LDYRLGISPQTGEHAIETFFAVDQLFLDQVKTGRFDERIMKFQDDINRVVLNLDIAVIDHKSEVSQLAVAVQRTVTMAESIGSTVLARLKRVARIEK